ncbi:MAG: sulfur carrier protein [Thermoleophilaceae bacterium]|jgi:sulfur carrier protein|nr:sulfur carrier protein [Thermoleophilaceae bacterium]
MTIWVNGEERDLPSGATVAAVVAAIGAPADGRGIAAAVDGEVVPRDQWQQLQLADGQRVEVVQAVQGG